MAPGFPPLGRRGAPPEHWTRNTGAAIHTRANTPQSRPAVFSLISLLPSKDVRRSCGVRLIVVCVALSQMASIGEFSVIVFQS
jgi:hypothetical protein